MAVLKKLRSRLFAPPPAHETAAREAEISHAVGAARDYDIRPLTISQLDEVWRLDQRCFVDGEAYSRETFDYLLTAPEAICYRAVTPAGAIIGFIVGLVEPQQTGHVTTLGVAPEHRRRGVARQMLLKIEEGFRRRRVRTIRLEVRSTNAAAQSLYRTLGYTVTQRLPQYYSNGGDGLMMVKAIE